MQTIKYVEVNGQRFIVDGHHRAVAARQLGIENVPAEEVQLPYGSYKTVEDLISGW